MKDTTLVIMAAGIGSRFGKGIKQLTPVGPSGELIMDYSVHDALKAGFNNIVFIIRKDILDEFHETIGKRIEKIIDVNYVFQSLDDIPGGFEVPKGRVKPWGTGQAVLCCKGKVTTPFAVINADDYYGIEPYKLIHDHLISDQKLENEEIRSEESKIQNICMAGFKLGNTLSENGGVTRGICSVDSNNNLIDIDETKNIIKIPDGAMAGDRHLCNDTTVSMNMWGFEAGFIDQLEEGFTKFLKDIKSDDITSEFLLPIYIDELLKANKARVKVIETSSRWFGVTYQEDKEAVINSFAGLVESGIYKKDLYKD